jgi:6-phospho-3-hexuloisomerase
MKNILKELQTMYTGTKGIKKYISLLESALQQNKDIIGIGAGRMGYSLRAHIMRLSHIGYNAYFIGDTTLPRIDKNTVVIINTSSGETPTNILYARQASAAGSYIITVTSHKNSTIAKLSDLVVETPTLESHQLMKTIYEQYSYILFDYVTESVVAGMGLDRDIITHNHSILE